MTKTVSFPSFKTSFSELVKKKGRRVLVEFYHNDVPSEPTVSILSNIADVFHDVIEGDDYISIRFIEGTDLSFSSDIYSSNLSNGTVVFGSLVDSGTYCVISEDNLTA